MNDSFEKTPVILLDKKKSRIRIHRQTLHLMGDPQFVVFLVNPEQRAIALCKSCKDDKLAHKIDWDRLSGHTCCEVYSTGLMRALESLCPHLSSAFSYRIAGRMIPHFGIAQFKVDESVAIDCALPSSLEVKYG